MLRTLASTLILTGAACVGGGDPPPPDGDGTDVLTFENLRAEEVTATTARLRFLTSEPTSCEVEYGTADDALNDIATDPTMDEGELDADHDVLVEGLTPETTYHWRARVVDAAEKVTRSEVLTFTTLAAEETGEENVAALDMGASISGVSSNFGGAANDQSWGANKAIDGLLATAWATNGDGDGAWLEVTLASERTIRAVGFQSRQMSDGSSIISEFRLTDGASNVLAGPFTAASPDTLYRFEIDPAVSARVVRLEAVTTTGGNTGAMEWQLFSAVTP